jgi:hypothetical protein
MKNFRRTYKNLGEDVRRSRTLFVPKNKKEETFHHARNSCEENDLAGEMPEL